MMLLYSKLIGSPIAGLKDSAKVGTVADLIINDTDLTVAAVMVVPKLSFVAKQKVVSSTDFVHLTKNGLIISDEEALVEISELVRVETLYKNKCFGLAQKVVTKSGAYIGHVYDYLIDSATCAIHKFYVKKLLNDRIIPASAVIAMEGKLITIKDDKPYVFVPSVETAMD
ncbi:MAG: hypothetical protein Q7S80_02620 [bacterium]|nr:hypothetical protein [bacterium]